MARDSTPPHKNRRNACFGCGEANPDGLQLRFRRLGDETPPRVLAKCRIPRRFHGAPGMLHGGIVATLLDEAMAKVNAHVGVTAVTQSLQVTYRRPVPTSRPVEIEGRHVRVRGRYVYNHGEIRLPNGKVLATAKGRFVILPREAVQKILRAND